MAIQLENPTRNPNTVNRRPLLSHRSKSVELVVIRFGWFWYIFLSRTALPHCRESYIHRNFLFRLPTFWSFIVLFPASFPSRTVRYTLISEFCHKKKVTKIASLFMVTLCDHKRNNNKWINFSCHILKKERIKNKIKNEIR